MIYLPRVEPSRKTSYFKPYDQAFCQTVPNQESQIFYCVFKIYKQGKNLKYALLVHNMKNRFLAEFAFSSALIVTQGDFLKNSPNRTFPLKCDYIRAKNNRFLSLSGNKENWLSIYQLCQMNHSKLLASLSNKYEKTLKSISN